LAAAGSQGEAIDQERTGIIQQTFAFENGQQAMGRSQWAEHRGRGHGVGWSDNRAERNGRCPWDRRYQRVGHDSDGGGGKAHDENDQPKYRRPVIPEIPDGRVVGRIEQYGRDEQRQRKLGGNSERGRTGKKPEAGAPECKKYG